MDRVSNLMYPRGAIVTIKDTDQRLGECNKFLNNRPLIVMSVQTQMFDRLTVVSCGSRNRPGIEISIKSHATGGWIGGYKYAHIYPWSLYTIYVSQISSVLGYLDPWIMNAVDQACLYHLGLNPVPPPYMKDIHEALYEPSYTMATADNTQLGQPHPMISSLMAPTLPRATPDPGAPNPKNTSRAKPKITTTTHSASASSRVFTVNSRKPIPIPAPKNPNSLLCRSRVLSMSDVDTCRLVFKKYGEVSFRNSQSSNKPLDERTLKDYREHLLYALDVAGSFSERIQNALSDGREKLSGLEDTFLAIMALYIDPASLPVSIPVLSAAYSKLMAKYHVDISSEKFKECPNWEFLKSIES